ncbi:putative zinc-binding metallopeptidase [Candidatus Nitrotoga sp. M5]|uniref:putative zinc-binding metallopeptidase n=1 Tax=Candidatus Nitrotoga sp. M5 TaxID=2890409 RepID=UPI001EF3081F|nr:putative zinc-binding metallopeptidase [Candidatus Nitrotoga sp. M5]CAH1386952.1 zinc-ribbon_6 domain-containing protein [Candidatus Nitrotoga sp. M5]
MKTFSCTCSATVFFENSQCVACSSELGWCPACNALRAISQDTNGQYYCGESKCGRRLTKCHNYAVEHVCNRCMLTDTMSRADRGFCDYCRFNDTIPDLRKDGNREKWGRIEIAKRRLLYTLDLLRLPYGDANDGVIPPLAFDFKDDIKSPPYNIWWDMSKEEQVYTGHANGKITINIREADHVEREKARISFGEAHRTVIGHFRHEMGHYFWDLLVLNKCEADFMATFGDHNNPDYSTALEHYYKNGPAANWRKTYISAYATMHPWEDFAESFAAYLNIVTVVDTAFNSTLIPSIDPLQSSFEDMVEQYWNLGLLFNEMNRAMGLLDLVPVVHTPKMLEKVKFIHVLLHNAAKPLLHA